MIDSLQTMAVEITINRPDGINATDPSEATFASILQIFFGVVAAVAVLVITIAALQFALSRGNPDKQAKARNAIIYAAIGLVVIVLANVIVSLVIGLTG